ncbi:MAG: hypothetical protein JETT_3896 [Candidatus Jettenia ecosi]|uniref:Uncharacterized protein n=1 Tax=Candidatus Jettenia ecosi TaxID=2494326 RepID=A0A533Q5N0_9BACT|nr:MAG: hypothetical protein JETT_3896 [Candidatus Jettenia ecosi]
MTGIVIDKSEWKQPFHRDFSARVSKRYRSSEAFGIPDSLLPHEHYG